MKRAVAWRWHVAVGVCLLAACSLNPNPQFVPGDSEVVFRDDFDAAQLGAGWTFSGADPTLFSLAERPGFLRLLPQAAGTEPADSSQVLRPASGDFVLVTRMAFDPVADRHVAGLVVEGADGRTVTLSLLSASFSRGVFRGLSAVAERAGGGEPDTEFESFSGDEVYLRMERSGSDFLVSYSTDGVTYFRFGTVSADLSSEVNVGVGTLVRENCESRCDEAAPADFDFFEVREPDA